MALRRLPRFAVVLTAGLGVAAMTALAEAQSGNYLIPAKPRATLQAPGTNGAMAIHRNALGKPCLNYEAMSRAHINNPDIYDNVVSVTNQCAQRILVKLCYFKSEACLDLELPPFQRKDAILGVRPQSQYFRYSYKEKF